MGLICTFPEKLSGVTLALPEVTQSEVAQKQKLKVVIGSVNQVRMSASNHFLLNYVFIFFILSFEAIVYSCSW